MIEISENQVNKKIKSLNLKKGSSCLLHSSLIKIGKIKGVKIDDTPKVIINLILKEIGTHGTLSVLTPSYEYSNLKKIFDLGNGKCSKKVGSVNQYMAKICKSRSKDPTFNISSIGKMANYINKNVSPTSFGLDSSWDRLYKLNTDMIFLGCNLSVCTFVRYIENRFGVTYLYNKYFSTPIKKNGKIISNYSSSLLRYRQIEIQYELKSFETHLLKKKLLRKTSSKNFTAMAIKMNPCLEEGILKLKKNCFYFLKKNPYIKKNKILPQD